MTGVRLKSGSVSGRGGGTTFGGCIAVTGVGSRLVLNAVELTDCRANNPRNPEMYGGCIFGGGAGTSIELYNSQLSYCSTSGYGGAIAISGQVGLCVPAR